MTELTTTPAPAALGATMDLHPGIDGLRVRIAMAAAAFALCYVGLTGTLVRLWATNPLYSFGFAVPLISAYFVRAKWQQVRALRPGPDYLLGIPVTIAGVGMLMVGHLDGLLTVPQASMIVVLAGLVLMLFGRDMFKLLRFPISYLLLMVPVWDYPIALLQAPSQTLSAVLAVGLLHLTGIPVLREGTHVVLPNLTLEVLRECSGVNQVVTIIAMALPAAYLFLRGHRRRIVFVSMAVGVAYLSNGIRIALSGILAYKGLSDGNIGSLHLLEGLAVSLVGYIAIGACLSVLAGTKSVNSAPGRVKRLEPPRPPNPLEATRRRTWLELAVLVVVLAAGGYRLLLGPAEVRLSGGLNSLPRQINDWMVDTRVEPGVRFPAIDDAFVQAYPTASGERRFEDADDELVRTYRSATGERVRLYIGYHRFQHQGKELAGDASRILDRVASPVRLQIESETIKLNEVLEHRDRRGKGILYWYDLNGRIVANIYLAKAYTLWDALARYRTNGAVIMVGWDWPAGVAFDASRQKAFAFVRALVPLLRARLPG
jgi:EpsI family protein